MDARHTCDPELWTPNVVQVKTIARKISEYSANTLVLATDAERSIQTL